MTIVHHEQQFLFCGDRLEVVACTIHAICYILRAEMKELKIYFIINFNQTDRSTFDSTNSPLRGACDCCL